MFKKSLSLSNLTLLVALSLSTVAAYYSIIGLTAIFAGAVVPIIVMGSILEVGKITTTVWLRKYWNRASWVIKCYLVPAVVLLAFLTSMGIFGFLSKAHSDQSLVSGDVLAKLEVYDQKIQTAKENIQGLRNELKQLDSAVDQVMARSTTEQGADKSNNIRKSQQRDRTRIAKEIEANQKLISSLNDQAAPIRAEVRKVEAEVGPIKYIAAMIYGDTADHNLLEAAVRWVIILIVIVFDPLAIALVLAANASKTWDDEPVEEKINWQERTDELIEIFDEPINEVVEPEPVVSMFKDPGEHPKDSFDYEEEVVEQPAIAEPEPEPVEPEPEKPILEQHPYLHQKFVHFTDLKPMVYVPEESEEEAKEPTIDSEVTADSDNKILALGVDIVDRPGDYLTQHDIITEGVTKLSEDHGDYVVYEGKAIRKDALKELHPEVFRVTADNERKSNSGFGTSFPEIADKGDTFVRVDVLPNRVYKFDGKRWIEINKETTNTYLYDKEYVKHLVSMIENGQYDVELLSENEQREIENYIRDQNS